MFLAGHAESSFRTLEDHGLLPALFPETAVALETNRSGALRTMLLQALRNTDERIAQEKPVTPAFLFAALLWPAYCRELAVLQKAGIDPLVAQQRAADRVTLHQAQRIALPRRFSQPHAGNLAAAAALQSARAQARVPPALASALPRRVRLPGASGQRHAGGGR